MEKEEAKFLVIFSMIKNLPENLNSSVNQFENLTLKHLHPLY